MKKRRSSKEQLKIAGTERIDRVPELDQLAEEYRDIDDQYRGLGEEKTDLADRLVATMQERGLERYVYEDRAGQLQEISVEELTIKVKDARN
jgi:hypothetical protein